MVGLSRRRGELVIAAASFTEAVQIVSDETVAIDILITDGRMPDGSDRPAAVARSADRAGRSVDNIMMTGHCRRRGK